MKASLVSATSLVALLAFEISPAQAGPLVNITASNANYSSCTNTSSASSCTLTFYALPGQASSQTETLTATYSATYTLSFNVSFSKATSPYTGAANNSLPINPPQSVTSNTTVPYGYTGQSAGSSGASASATQSVKVTVTNNTVPGTSQTSTVTLQGTTVAPIESVSNTNSTYTLVGTSKTSTVTVTNKGKGNLATGTAGTGKGIASSLSNLNGSLASSSGVFTGSGGTLGGGTGLPDTTSSAASSTSQAFTYVFTPTVRGAASTSVAASFTNGDSGGGNASNTQSVTLSGTGVAPLETVTISNAAGSGGGSANTGNLGNILVGESSSAVVTVQNTGDGNLDTTQPTSVSNLNGSITNSASAPFSGSAGKSVSLNDPTLAGGTTSSTFTYVYAPTVRSGGATQSMTVTSAFSNGSSIANTGMNKAETVVNSITGVAVAPVFNSASGGNAGDVLVNNNSATVTVTVSNTGDGNKSGLGSVSNLNGTLGLGSGMFANSTGSTSPVSVGDTSTGTGTYIFTPTQIGATSTSVTASFSNGSTDGKNQSFSTAVTVSGTGVAPLQNVTSSNAGYVLVGGGNSGAASVTVTNTGNGNLDTSVAKSISNLNGTIGSGNSVFVGGPSTLSGPEQGLRDGASQTQVYTFTPTVATSSSTTATIVTTFTNGNSSGNNSAQTVTSTISGQGVAPIQTNGITNNSVGTGAGSDGTLGAVLVGQTVTAQVTVQNTGNGNLATGGPSPVSNLNGSLSTPASDPTITGSGGSLGSGSGLPDATNGQPVANTSQTFNYTYAPTIRGPSGANSATVTATFTNGSSDAMNNSESVSYTITGQGVAPVDSGMTGSNAGYVLVKTGSASVSVTVSNASGDGNLSNLGSISNLNATLQNPSGSSQFSGGTFGVSLQDGQTQTYSYTFAPTVRGADSATVTGNFVNGSADNLNQSHTNAATVYGTGVAPVNSVSSVSPVYARVGGTSATATVTVTNTGDGNLATGGPDPSSNLQGSVGGAVGPSQWSGSGGTLNGANGLPDATNGQPLANTSQSYGYTYNSTGTARGTSLSATVSVGLTNGSSDGMNNSQTVNVTLVGETVGPQYQSFLHSADNTPGKNGNPPTSTIDWGTVGTKAGPHLELMSLVNKSTDPNGGNSLLTDLSIESFTITGSDADHYSIGGQQSGTLGDVLQENGGHTSLYITFNSLGDGPGSFDDAMLTIMTDEDTTFGGTGNYYEYDLTAATQIATPEPGSLLLVSVGLGGVMMVRRRKRRDSGSRQKVS